jgi:glycosyltransferase involved in cell wall biosynthesis
MKILYLTNFYPPHVVGGMERSCQAVVQGLEARGHVSRVLTSIFGVERASEEGPVMRKLRLQMDFVPAKNAWAFLNFRRQRKANRRSLEEAISGFEPDAVFVWGMWNLDVELAFHAEALMKGRVLYRMADYWPTLPSQRRAYWQAKGQSGLATAMKRTLAPLALAYLKRDEGPSPALRQGYCVSFAVRRRLVESGVPVGHWPVVYTGLDLSRFDGDPRTKWSGRQPVLKLLFAGRLVPQKGLETLLRALAEASTARPEASMELTVVGSGTSEYVDSLRREADRLGIQGITRFLGAVEHDAVARLMESHAVVVVPSVWEDPLPRVAMEAMAAGCVVIGSRIGGLEEIIEDGRSGRLFPPGDHRALAGILADVAKAESQLASMASNARQQAVGRFSQEAMLDRIEELLEGVRDVRSPIPPGSWMKEQDLVSQARLAI